jgi:hypothetical protein
MADSKITALTAISTVDPTADPLVIVDVSETSMAASGTTKKSTINQLLGSGGTATLASATISGDLTVDTNVLKVDTTNNRVGIGTATPLQALHVRGNILTGSAAGTDSFLNVTTDGVQNSLFGFNNSGSTNAFGATNNNTYIGSGNNYGLQIIGNSSVLASFSTSGVFTFFDGAGGTRMTLNATGLGVGVVPAAGDGSGVFKAAGTGVGTANTRMGIDTRETTSGNAAGIWIGAMNSENTGVIGSRTASGNIAFQTFNGSAWGERMRIDYLGNLILQSPTTPATLTVNGQLTVNATSDTNLRFSYRGSDGVTRTANLTLAP